MKELGPSGVGLCRLEHVLAAGGGTAQLREALAQKDPAARTRAVEDVTQFLTAGPYKAPRLAQTAARVVVEGEGTFHRRVVAASGGQALAYLESFPGVAHKTAACVLVFSALSTTRLLAYGPDLAPAHFLFLLVGRDTCLKAAPSCPVCFLRPHCQFATSPHARSALPAGVPVATARTRRHT